MKRSQINQAIKKMETLLEKHCFALPEFCRWTPQDWENKGNEYDEIRDNMLGWDVTDYGMGHFETLGLLLITIRNGDVKNPLYKKPYAEKIMMLEENQLSAMHFHWNKMEDIINRGGGNLGFHLYNATPKGEKADSDVEISVDGHAYSISAGGEVVLAPGQSLTLYPYCYHEFYVMPGTGATLIGEVSMCNDDSDDNRFFDELGRFPAIEEDEPAYRLLCTEYPR